MVRFLVAAVTPVALLLATEPQERVVESVLPALTYGPSCWSSLELHNLGERAVTVEVEAHRASGALVSLKDHPQVVFSLRPGEHATFRLAIEEETGDAWVKVREHVPSQRLWPVVAVAGATECVVNNQLRTSAREVAYPMRNPWFSGDVSEMTGNLIAAVNTAERAAKISLCYSAGNLYSTPDQASPDQLKPICSQFSEVQLPPLGARQFPVQHDGSVFFSFKVEGVATVLQMLRPVASGVKVYSVDSTIRFQQ